jgi:hypothetical protein
MIFKNSFEAALYYYESFISPAFILIPILVALFRLKFLTAPFKVLFWYLVGAAILNGIVIYLGQHAHPTLFMFHIYSVFEFAFISLFYDYLFEGRWRKTMLTLVIVFTIFCVLDYFYIQPGIQVDTYTESTDAIIIIGYSVLFLNQQGSIEEESSWQSNALNWANIGFLIYYGCGFLLFVSTNYIISKGLEANLIVWAVFDTILVFQCLLFAVGFYKCRT